MRISPFSLAQPFISCNTTHMQHNGPTLWIVFHKDKILVESKDDDTIAICTTPPVERGILPYFQQFLGNYDGVDILVAELNSEPVPLPENMHFFGLRALFGKIDRELFGLAGRAIQIIHWNRDHNFCGRCGTKMAARKNELAKKCPTCAFTCFPRLSPAVIMSVVRGDEILLGRSPHFPEGMYSTLAGFVDPGETLEEAVSREVREEVSIEIGDIQYVASQPWPFPHSLMIGFSSNYQGGTLRIDNKEIEDAGWFSRDNLPPLPSRISIARHLIDMFINS